MRIFPALLLIILTSALQAQAAGLRNVRVAFSGEVLAGSCSLAMEDTWQAVDMGAIPFRSLTSGAAGPQQPFSLRLTGCDLAGASAAEAARRVQVIFDGVRGETADRFAVAGRASGIDLQVLDGEGYIARAGEVMPPRPLSQTQTLHYTLRMVRNSAPPEAGDWSATLRFRVLYE